MNWQKLAQLEQEFIQLERQMAEGSVFAGAGARSFL